MRRKFIRGFYIKREPHEEFIEKEGRRFYILIYVKLYGKGCGESPDGVLNFKTTLLPSF